MKAWIYRDQVACVREMFFDDGKFAGWRVLFTNGEREDFDAGYEVTLRGAQSEILETPQLQTKEAAA